MQKEFGTPGVLRPGGWWAERAPHIKVDVHRVRRFDVVRIKRKYQRTWLSIFSVCVILGSLPCFPNYWLVGAGMFTLGCAGVLLICLLTDGRGFGDYTDGYLAPGMMLPGDSSKLLVLVPISFTGKTVFGCCVMDLGNGDWTDSFKDRLPCSVWFDSLDLERRIFKMFHPLPLVWATIEREQLEACVKTIDEEEWLLLERIALQADKFEMNIPYEVQIKKEGTKQMRFIKLADRSVLNMMHVG